MAITNTSTGVDGLYHWEKTLPNKVYLTQPHDGGQTTDYTWAEVGNEARRMATYLKSLNYPTGSNIALISKNCAHWIITDLAIWLAGHVSVPLYPTLNSETVKYILDHSEAKLLFIGKLDDWDTMKAGISADIPKINFPLSPAQGDLPADCEKWYDVINGVEPMTESPVRGQDEMATIVYTSGSTGRPKGVMISFGAIAASASFLANITDVSPDSRMISYLPLAHVYERMGIEANSLRYGSHVFFAEELNTFPADLRRARPTFFHSVPRLWVKFQLGVMGKIGEKKFNRLMKLPIIRGVIKKKILTQLGLENVHIAATGSAPLPSSVIAWYRSLGLELLEGYGMTENFAYSHCSLPGRSRVGYVGHSQEGVITKIADNSEILIKSPGNMIGYYKNPEKTAEDLTKDGFLKTGDMGELDEDGRLKITGRIKELFKTSKGKYVAPVPIENKLCAHRSIEVVCITGANQTQPYGLVLLSDDDLAARAKGNLDEAALTEEFTKLIGEVNATLDPHEHVKFLLIVKDTWSIENGFLTPTMKIKRNVIEDYYAPEVDAWYGAKKKVIWES
jgi:long-chain acyl-CoA synthetase